jgi:hypothetical protein
VLFIETFSQAELKITCQFLSKLYYFYCFPIIRKFSDTNTNVISIDTSQIHIKTVLHFLSRKEITILLKAPFEMEWADSKKCRECAKLHRHAGVGERERSMLSDFLSFLWSFWWAKPVFLSVLHQMVYTALLCCFSGTPQMEDHSEQ